MKKSFAAMLLLLAAAAAAGAQTPGEWIKFTPPESYFSILLPAQPTADVKTARDEKVGPYTVHLFLAKANDEIYLVGWVDYAAEVNLNVQGELEANRDNFVKTMKANLLGTTPIKLGAHPGIEFKAELPGRGNVVSRVYVVGRRPFQLIAITPVGRDTFANVERFFSSFKIGPAK